MPIFKFAASGGAAKDIPLFLQTSTRHETPHIAQPSVARRARQRRWCIRRLVGHGGVGTHTGSAVTMRMVIHPDPAMEPSRASWCGTGVYRGRSGVVHGACSASVVARPYVRR